MTTENKSKRGLGFRIFSEYIRFFHDKVYYRKVYWLDRERIPEDGPLMIVSDHQNCLSDALGVILSLNKRKHRKLRLLSRADLFKPVFNKPLRWLGIMPSYRLLYDGEETLSNNSMTFEETENELLNDGTVVIYPEAGHQDKHWLGQFSLAYLRILFETARKTNFEKELFILPSCNHYSDYFDMREEFLIRYGTPISLKPFYELYQTKPRTAQRKVNALVRQQISDLMLNITDLDNYDSIDYIRQSTYGFEYAGGKGFFPELLPEKLLADKQLFKELEQVRAAEPEALQEIYDDTRKLSESIKQLRLKDWNFEKEFNPTNLIIEGLLYLLVLPLFLVAFLSHLLIIYLPKIVTSKLNDKMFLSTINFGASVLITIPITYIALFILTLLTTKSVIYALIYIVCMPFLGIFAWNFKKRFGKWLSEWRFNRLFKQGKLTKLIEQRKHIFESLDKLLTKHT